MGIRVILFRLTGVVLSLNLFAEAFPLKLSAPRGLRFPLRGVSSSKRSVQCPCSQLRPELPQRLPGRLAQLPLKWSPASARSATGSWAVLPAVSACRLALCLAARSLDFSRRRATHTPAASASRLNRSCSIHPRCADRAGSHGVLALKFQKVRGEGGQVNRPPPPQALPAFLL